MRNRRHPISTPFALSVTLLLLAGCHNQTPNPKAVSLNNDAAQYVLHRQRAKALELFNEAVTIDPSYYLAHANIMSLYLTEHNFPKALSQADELTTLQTRNPYGWLYRGLIETRLGKTEHANNSFMTLEQIYEQQRQAVKQDHLTQFLLDYATVLKLLHDTEKYNQVMNQIPGADRSRNSDTYYRLLQNSTVDQLVQVLIGDSYQARSPSIDMGSP